MDEGLSFSDIFDDEIPYEQKPPEMLRPMEEIDYPVQTKNLFKGLWQEDLLTEVHLQDLYHATNAMSLLGMIKDNAVKLAFAGGTEADQFYNKGYPFFLSTMRQKYGNYAHDIGGEFVGNKYDVVVHLDGKALTDAGFKHFPIDFWSQGPQYSEQEERIVSNKDEIIPMKKFVKDVHVYIPKDLKHSFTIDALHQISDLAPEIGVKVYFYPSDAVQYFRSQRINKAVMDVDKILPPAQFSADDLEWMEWRKNRLERKDESYLDALMRIYKGDYSNSEVYPDKNLLRMLWWHEYDLYPALFAAAHNAKPKHLPIFRDIVAAMKKEGVKTFRDLIKLVRERELERLDKERLEEGIICETDVLLVGSDEYNWNTRNAFCTFVIDPEFSVWVKIKNYKSIFYSDNEILQKELSKFNGLMITSHGGIDAKIQLVIDQTDLPYRNYWGERSMYAKARGRMWGINGKLYITFWEPLEKLKSVWPKIEEIIRKVGYTPDMALYMFDGTKDAEQYAQSYEYVLQGIDFSQARPPEEYDKVLRKYLHINPQAKKLMIQAGPDRIQSYADLLGIPVIKLKQMLGSMDETMFQ